MNTSQQNPQNPSNGDSAQPSGAAQPDAQKVRADLEAILGKAALAAKNRQAAATPAPGADAADAAKPGKAN